jgi:hypothetical protein
LGPWCNCWRGYQVESKIPGEFSVCLKSFFTECSNSWLPDQNNVKQRNEVRFFMEIPSMSRQKLSSCRFSEKWTVKVHLMRRKTELHQ